MADSQNPIGIANVRPSSNHHNIIHALTLCYSSPTNGMRHPLHLVFILVHSH